jgi:aspartyl/asparaginyl beta-hydroxylase (cupin superfamily)
LAESGSSPPPTAASARGAPDPAATLAALDAVAQGRTLSADEQLGRAFALRAMGRPADALAALDAALVLDPQHLLALLAKAATLEALGRRRTAARIYGDALAMAPPPGRERPDLAQPLARARRVVAEAAAALEADLRAAVGDAGPAEGALDEALRIFAGAARPMPQAPLLFQWPRLPAIPFHGRDAFPWLADLEAATPAIAAEMEAAIAQDWDRFGPYIEFPPGVPTNQWAELNHNRAWSTLYLWRDGQRFDAACARCPQTAAVLARLPMLDQPGFGPTAMFSALAPRTRIPPHTGSSNARLIVHLPLRLPGPAGFRVGNVTRHWRIGEAWVFDDTIEHEAWNDADETRVILIFDIWHPALSAREREAVTAMMAARARWFAAESG